MTSKMAIGLEFTLDAPEDMSLHNELMAMSVEQRGRLAVTMLTTGMYIGGLPFGSYITLTDMVRSSLETT